MKIVAIIQARMTSTRLPGKVLKRVLDKTLLEYQLERVNRSQLIDEIIIATTVNQTDDPIVDLCDKLGYSFFRGSEEDVLSRYYEAAEQVKADTIVRLTSDCPLIDPKVIDQVIQLYTENQPNVDYASNSLERTYPRGMDTEVISIDALRKTWLEAKLSLEREHVTAYVYTHPKMFTLINYANEIDQSDYRWTVDTKEDFDLISLVIEALYPSKRNFDMQDVLKLLEKNPSWNLLNAHIEQKKL